MLAVTNQSPITIETATCMHRKRKPYNSFFMANMASSMDRVHMLPTTPTQWNIAAIFHLKPSCSLGLIVHIWYWKSMLWSIDSCQNKVFADQYHVTISLTQVLCSSTLHVFWPLANDWFLLGLHMGLSQVNFLTSAGLLRKCNFIVFM